MEELLTKILDVLDESYQSTNQIALKVKINWYRVEHSLEILLEKGLVEKLELLRRVCWRKK